MLNKFEEAKKKGSDFLSSFVFRYGNEMTASELIPSLSAAISDFLTETAADYDINCLGQCLLIDVTYDYTGTEYSIEISEDCLTLRLKELRAGGYENMWTASDRYQFEELFEDFCEQAREIKHAAAAYTNAR